LSIAWLAVSSACHDVCHSTRTKPQRGIRFLPNGEVPTFQPTAFAGSGGLAFLATAPEEDRSGKRDHHDPTDEFECGAASGSIHSL
jgi:hypothetical protein